VLPCSWFITFENKWQTFAPTSDEIKRPPSASIHLRHVTEEGNSTRGCTAATGHQPRDSLAKRSPEPENEGYQPNTAGGVRPRNQRPGSHTLTSAEEEREGALASRPLEEDRWICWRNVSHHPDDQGWRPQQRELRQESSINDDEWYDDFHHGNFAFDDASPLAAELQATPWPSSYKSSQLPMYDGIQIRSIFSWVTKQPYPHMVATRLSWRNPSSW
jgi:hypothetical protein